MKRILAVALIFSLLLSACGGSDKRSKDDSKTKDKYEKTKEDLAEAEKKSPAMFLSVTAKDRKNLIGQTVVKGMVTNNAKVTSFKDISVEISYFSKTGTLLGKLTEVVYENIGPGDSKNFKAKDFAPKGTDSIDLKVVGAKTD